MDGIHDGRRDKLQYPADRVTILNCTDISKITSVKGKMTVNYKKLNVDKYQINYSLSPTMKDYKTVYVKGADNLKTTISNLVSGKKYYVKLRGIKRVNKVNYYTPYGNYTEIMVK